MFFFKLPNTVVYLIKKIGCEVFLKQLIFKPGSQLPTHQLPSKHKLQPKTSKNQVLLPSSFTQMIPTLAFSVRAKL